MRAMSYRMKITKAPHRSLHRSVTHKTVGNVNYSCLWLRRDSVRIPHAFFGLPAFIGLKGMALKVSPGRLNAGW